MAQKFSTSRSPGGHLLTINSTDELAAPSSYLEEVAKHGGSHGYVLFSYGSTEQDGLWQRSANEFPLYVGIVLRPPFSAARGSMLSVLGALALARTVSRHSDGKPLIRWVSDVYSGRRRIAFVKTHAALSTNGGLRYATVHLSLLITENFEGTLHEVVSSVFSSQRETLLERVAGTLISEFFTLYESFATTDSTAFLEEYRSLSLLQGKRIRFLRDGKRHRATVIGIDDNARLVVTPRRGRSELLCTASELYDPKRTRKTQKPL